MDPLPPDTEKWGSQGKKLWALSVDLDLLSDLHLHSIHVHHAIRSRRGP